MEIHVPRNFSRDRPPIHFAHVEFSVDMGDHPLASRLPKKTGNKPSIHEGCHVFREFSIPSTLPNNVNHYLCTDEPLICLQINSFTDGTLVSVTFPHVLSDAMGTADFIQAWAHILNNQNLDNLTMQLEGSTEDVVASVGVTEDEIAQNTRFVLEDRQMTGFPLLVFAARYAFDILTRRNIEARHIYLPASFLTYLRRQAEKEFRLDNEYETRSMPFVSDGDLITAWGSRMVLSSAPAKGAAAICNVFDMRKRLNLLNPSPAVRASTYMQNLILPSTTLLTAEEARSFSVYQIALMVRKAVVEQTSDAQVRSLMRIARTWFAGLGSMPLFGGWNTTRIIACTNWTKAEFLMRADFGSAAETDSGKRCVRQVRPVAYWGTTLAVSDNPRDTFVVYGKDADGDYWVHAYLRKETWNFIESELDQFTGT